MLWLEIIHIEIGVVGSGFNEMAIIYSSQHKHNLLLHFATELRIVQFIYRSS